MVVGKDAAKVSTMFAARPENGGDGMTWASFVHMVMEASNGRFDTEEVGRTLEEMFRSAQEKSDLTEYQLTSRIAEAEKTLASEEQQAIEAEARSQAMAIVADGEKRGQAIVDQAKAQAQVEADRIIQAAKDEAAQEMMRAKNALRDQVAQLAVAGAEQILKREVNLDTHKDLLDQLKAKL